MLLNHPLCMQGLSKCGLIGFCDVAPGQSKALRVLYLWEGRPHAVTFADKVPVLAALLLALLAELEPLHTLVQPLSMQCEQRTWLLHLTSD